MMRTSEPLVSIRVLLVDDHTLVTRALRMFLETEPGLMVVGEARSRAASVEIASRERPDVILLDLDLGGESGLDAIAELQKACPSARVLILTGLRDAQAHLRARRLGACGVVEKESAGDQLIMALRTVHAGEEWRGGPERALPPGSEGTEAPSPAPDREEAKIARLSARERDVLTLLAEGLSNRKIAERLYISETTVRHHLTSIFAKLEVHDRLELLLYSYRQKLVQPPSSG